MKKSDKAIFAAGCFWGVEEAFRAIKGVVSTAVGYTGGAFPAPTYEDVCTDLTGHAEAVLVEYDPEAVSYGQLLEVFWRIHDPTTLDRQGPDVGSQYRSAIFFFDPVQEDTARRSKEEMDRKGVFKRPIVTEITRAGEFYRAEEYHQRYYQKRGIRGCHL